MKIKNSLLLAGALCLAAVSAKADYSIQFATTLTATSPNAVFDVDGTTKVDNSFFAELSVNGTLVPNSIAHFGQNGNTVLSQLNGYVSLGTITVPSATLFGGSSASVQVFAWKGAADYATASVTPGAKIGNSAAFNITALGGLDQAQQNSFPVPNASGMSGFTMATVSAVPEPTTLALGLFGAAGLLIRRRK